MGTCMGNRPTVLEHVALSVGVQWALERTEDICGPLQYIDTHAMAPMNQPDPAGGFLANLIGAAAAVPAGGWPTLYQQTLHASRNIQATPQAMCYPTHFLHAAIAAHQAGVPFHAWLFENNAFMAENHEDRRLAIETFLAAPVPPAFLGMVTWPHNVNLAPNCGNWRHQNAWPEPGPRCGKALIVFNDPMIFWLHDGQVADDYMNPQDFNNLLGRIAARYQNRPRLTLNIILARAGRGIGAANEHAPFITAMGNEWSQRFAKEIPHAEPVPQGQRAWGGIRWGDGLVFVGAYVLENQADFVQSFAKLMCDTTQALKAIPSDCELNVHHGDNW